MKTSTLIQKTWNFCDTLRTAFAGQVLPQAANGAQASVLLARSGRGMVYFLPWQGRVAALEFEPAGGASPPSDSSLTPELGGLTPELSALAQELSALTPEQAQGKESAVISELSQLGPTELTRLRALAEPVTARRRAKPELLQQTVLSLCSGRYLGLRVLAQLLGRNADGVDLRKRILNPLVASKALQRAYPNPNDPRQAYTTSAASPTETPIR